MKHGKQVLCKLLLGGKCDVIKNHELSAGLLNDELDDLGAKSRKTVSVGNHKRDDSSAHRSFQYGPQSFSFEIDP